MELSAQEDIDAPMEAVFAELSDFENIERQALRRGVKISRSDDMQGTGPGMCWDVEASFRGKLRSIAIEMTGFTAEERMSFKSVTGGLEAETVVDVVALSKGRTRVVFTSVLLPKTLSARLLVQSLKLGKAGIEKRFRKRMAGLARELETKLKSVA